MQSKYALSSTYQARLTTLNGTICCPGTGVPGSLVDPVPVPPSVYGRNKPYRCITGVRDDDGLAFADDQIRQPRFYP